MLMAGDELLTTRQAAEILHISEEHVRRLCKVPEAKGGIFARRYGNGRGLWRIPKKRFYRRAGLEN